MPERTPPADQVSFILRCSVQMELEHFLSFILQAFSLTKLIKSLTFLSVFIFDHNQVRWSHWKWVWFCSCGNFPSLKLPGSDLASFVLCVFEVFCFGGFFLLPGHSQGVITPRSGWCWSGFLRISRNLGLWMQNEFFLVHLKSKFYFFLFYINFHAVILTTPDFLSAADETITNLSCDHYDFVPRRKSLTLDLFCSEFTRWLYSSRRLFQIMQFSVLIVPFIQSAEMIQAFASFFSLGGSPECQVKASVVGYVWGIYFVYRALCCGRITKTTFTGLHGKGLQCCKNVLKCVKD